MARKEETGVSRLPLAVVTGASEGLGRALSLLLSEEGYRVIAVARRRDALEATAREAAGLGGGVIQPLAADLETDGGIDAVTEAVKAAGRPLDLLVNNAGRGDIGALSEAAPEKLRGILRLNVEAPTLLMRRLLPVMAPGARILNVASVGAVLPGPWMATYYASKSYLLSLGLSLSEELKAHGISVTTVCPGPIASGFQRVAGFDEERYDRTTKAQTPAKVARWAYRAAMKKRTVTFDRWYVISDWAARLLPRTLFARLMARLQRRRAQST